MPSQPTDTQVKELFMEHYRAFASRIFDLSLSGVDPSAEPKLFQEICEPFFSKLCSLCGYDPSSIPPIPPTAEYISNLQFGHTSLEARQNIITYIQDHAPKAAPSHKEFLISNAAAAWKTPYVGNAHLLLRDAIETVRNMKSFTSPPENSTSYGNFFAIIQGSGTGKSRAVDKLSEFVFAIPFVLRKEGDKSGYPAGGRFRNIKKNSNTVSSVLETFCASESAESTSALQQKQLLLLLKCIEHARVWLEDQPAERTLKDVIQDWREKVISSDVDFYSAVNAKVVDSFNDLDVEATKDVKTTADSDPNTTKSLNDRVVNFTQSVIKLLNKRYDEDEKHDRLAEGLPKPYILFCFDEAHNLTVNRTKEEQSSTSRTAYQCLCKALSFFTGAQVFALFLSTYSRLSEFSPSNRNFWSARPQGQTGEALHPPFVELPFDIGPNPSTSILVREGQHMISDICTPLFMTRFGRPLFWALSRHLEEQHLINFAMGKLLGVKHDGSLDSKTQDQLDLLPLLAIRVDLTFESNRDEAVYLESLLVASSMRTVFSVPEHRQYLRGGYPSEPLLAEAASRKLLQELVLSKHNLELEDLLKSFKVELPTLLNRWLTSGLISKGERGELVARLLLTIAHDLAVIGLEVPKNPLKLTEAFINLCDKPQKVSFSRQIPVVNFLRALISKDQIDAVLESTPCNMKTGCSLKEAFEDAFVHFTHFVKGDDKAIVSDEACMIFMTRGAAIQGFTNLADIDIIIPVCMRDETLNRWSMSAIFLQIKNRDKHQSIHIDVEGGGQGKFHFFSKRNGMEDQRPYMTIAMEFGITSPYSVPPSQKKTESEGPKPKRKKVDDLNAIVTDVPGTEKPTPSRISTMETSREKLPRSGKKNFCHPCYAFNISGCSPTVYNAVDDKAQYRLLLANTGLLSEHPRQDKPFLDAVLKMKPFFRFPDSYDFVEMMESSKVTKTEPAKPDSVVEDPELVTVVTFDEFDRMSPLTELDDDDDDDGGLGSAPRRLFPGQSPANATTGDKRKRADSRQ